MITVFLKTLVKVDGLDEVYVFCSNPEIKEYLVDGVKFLERPEYLDTLAELGNEINRHGMTTVTITAEEIEI